MSKKHRGRIISMCKILVRSIVFRPPSPFGIKTAPIESPWVEGLNHIYTCMSRCQSQLQGVW